MEYRKSGSMLICRLDRGEKVHESLQAIASREQLQAGFLHGLGAVKNVELGYYHLEKKEYAFRHFRENMEVASMNGNWVQYQGGPFFHIHMVLSGPDLLAVGGHLKEAEVAVTLEMALFPLADPLKRVMNEDIGLPHLSF